MRDVQKILRRYEALKAGRSGWDSAWRALAELFLPGRWRPESDVTAWKSPRLDGRLVHSAGVLAMRTLASGMQGGMTSPVRPWFRLALHGRRAPGMNRWLEEAADAMQSALHQSDFYNAVHSLYADLGTFGTGLLIETADEDGLHFHVVRAGEYVLDIDGAGRVDTFFRHLSMTARQILDRFGDAAPAAVREAAQSESGALVRFDVVHGVFPRRDLEPGLALGPRSKPFASVYICTGASSGTSPALLSEGGYDMFPAFAPRWEGDPSCVYGRSPAMDVLPDCRMLQAMTSTLRRMQHKIAAPPVLADASLRAFGVELDPDAVNWVDYGKIAAQAGVRPVMPIAQPEPAALESTMRGIKDVEQIIRDGLYTDLFRMLIDNDRRQVTAFEVQAKQQEKLSLIGPVVERLIKELLEPLVLRTFALMRDWGALPEPPEGVSPAELDVRFDSVLAQAQRMTATSAIDQGLAFMVQGAQAAPELLDVLDVDAMGRAYLDRIGMPEGCVRDERAVRGIRERRARQQAAAQQQAAMKEGVSQAVDLSAAAKNLGQTPTGADGQSLMQTLLGGLGA